MHELDFPSYTSSSGAMLHPSPLEDAVQEANLQGHTTMTGAHSQNLVLSGESYRAMAHSTLCTSGSGTGAAMCLKARLKTKYILSVGLDDLLPTLLIPSF